MCGLKIVGRYFLATLVGFFAAFFDLSVSGSGACLFISSSGDRNGFEAGCAPLPEDFSLVVGFSGCALLAVCTGLSVGWAGAVPSICSFVEYSLSGLFSTDATNLPAPTFVTLRKT